MASRYSQFGAYLLVRQAFGRQSEDLHALRRDPVRRYRLDRLRPVLKPYFDDLLRDFGRDNTMSPSMTARIVWITSGPKMDLTRYPLAPACRMLNIVSTSVWTVRINTAVEGVGAP